ncbi:cupin-like domain-containing protein [Alteromonas sediminis]|uniref:Cupin-like domain-containing protein n=1 Tax=Alteromonas sediminis TaxID=2259342 RepID=A0A3N5Z8D8_9ALTE|nr:cupin-like domain-containing protein [Alteromonas sediminis]RPJ67094.1 cupin-like domain-containing protein [Alteromonas sediminis]
MTLHYGSPIEEISCSNGEFPAHLYDADMPCILRGMVADWPLVQEGLRSDQHAVDYLMSFYNQQPVNAFMAGPEAKRRIFYNDTIDGFNFVQSQVYLNDALNKIIEVAEQPDPPTFYVGSLEIARYLPGFSDNNQVAIDQNQIRESIWLGNRTVIAPHFDFPDNLACCVLGERKFTLFPPQEHNNLYVGPLDFTPAGQVISMVDVNAPDLERFPRFENAMAAAKTAHLKPGDAIYIPSMWWHAVEGLGPLNGLVNYWWRTMPDYLGMPNNALLHAIMSIKHLPKRQRQAWKTLFDNYVFEQPEDFYQHLPEKVRDNQTKMSDMTARKLRAQLINKLK